MSSPVALTGKCTDGSGTAIPAVVWIKLSWDAWLADDSAEIVQSSQVKIQAAADGTYSVNLYKNSDLLPANSYYTVRQTFNGNWDPPFTIVVTGAGTVASMVTSSPALPAQYVTGPTGPAGPGVQIKIGGGSAYPQEDYVNLIEGTAVVLSAADDPSGTRTDVTIGVDATQFDAAGAAAAAQAASDPSGSAATAQSNAESFATSAVGTETTRAEGVEATNATAITTETSRAETAEALKATDSLVVHLAGAETLTGTKSGAFLDDGGAVFNVKHPTFGAKGDGTTDDSAAILAAVNAAAAAGSGTNGQSRGTVYFPAGTYIVTSDAVLTPTTAATIPGIHIQGAGMNASILRFGTLSGATWFYDNGATQRTQFTTFENLGFQGMNPASFSVYTDIPTNANGFKITGTGNEQGFRWTNCRFRYLNVMFDMEGTNVASEMKFFGCHFDNCLSTFYLLNNSQSFDHEFYGCDVALMYGDVFALGTIAGNNAGGNVKIYGGYWNMVSDAASNHYFYNASANGGGPSHGLTANGMYFEFYGNFVNLVNAGGTVASQRNMFRFNDCDFHAVSTVTSNLTNWVTIQTATWVRFKGCTFVEDSTGGFFFVVTGGTTPYGENGVIRFDDCVFPIGWSDRCTISSRGGIHAAGCSGTNVGAPATGAHWAHDFDLSWNEATVGLYTGWTASGTTLVGTGSMTNAAVPLKSVFLKQVLDHWPTNVEQTLFLPKNAIIKNIHLRKPASGSDTTVTTMVVGRNDKSGTPHLTSDSQQMDVAQMGDTTNYFYHVGTGTNERTLRLYSSAVTTGNYQGGFVIVEYY